MSRPKPKLLGRNSTPQTARVQAVRHFEGFEAFPLSGGGVGPQSDFSGHRFFMPHNWRSGYFLSIFIRPVKYISAPY